MSEKQTQQEVVLDQEEQHEEPKKKKLFSKKADESLEIIEKLQQENQELKNQYYKAYADADNFKKRSAKELENAMKYRIQSFASEILPAIDNLERALDNETSDEAMRTGVKMIYDQIIAALKKEGVSEIEALDQPFDHNVHQALLTEKVEDVEPNQVVEVLQKGYMLKDRVLRASLVKVSE